MRKAIFALLSVVICVGGFLTGRSLAQDCTMGQCQAPCNTYDGPFNGNMVGHTCVACGPSNNTAPCCPGVDSQGNPICTSGLCRTETCTKCSGPGTGSASQCQNQEACGSTITSLCVNACG